MRAGRINWMPMIRPKNPSSAPRQNPCNYTGSLCGLSDDSIFALWVAASAATLGLFTLRTALAAEVSAPNAAEPESLETGLVRSG